MKINHYTIPGLSKAIDEKEYLEYILSTVSEETGISVDQIKGPRGKTEVATARHLYCKIAKEKTKAYLKVIGKLISRDHTTVLNSIKTLNDLIETEPETRHLYNVIEQKASKMICQLGSGC